MYGHGELPARYIGRRRRPTRRDRLGAWLRKVGRQQWHWWGLDIDDTP
jgi:hypothetical protein